MLTNETTFTSTSCRQRLSLEASFTPVFLPSRHISKSPYLSLFIQLPTSLPLKLFRRFHAAATASRSHCSCNVMLRCSGRAAHGCTSCKGGAGGDSSSSSDTTSTSTEAAMTSSHQVQRHHGGVAAFLAAFSPRALFRQFRKGGAHEFTMPKAERTMKAAILIQRWYRRYLARMEIRRRYTWNIFQSIEYQGEQDQVKLYKFFNALLTHIPTQNAVEKTVSSDATSKSSSTDTTAETKFEEETPSDTGSSTAQPVESNYRGIHIGSPLTKRDLENLLESFKKKKQHRLHAKYVSSIFQQAVSHLKKLPNLNLASTAISKQITICGDIHGKLDDLLTIFHKNGLPSAENPYVFNGDFVDRGKKGLEVLLVLLCCLIVFPDGVHLNRGNHEDHVMNTRYGFIREMKMKYKHNSERLLKQIDTVYRWLPLGTIVNGKVLVVHGGISDITDLEWIKRVDRSKYISLLRPPVQESGHVQNEVIDKIEWKQVFDLLWSDPQSGDGCVPNSLRGAGTYFGPDVTNKFLQKHSLSLLVRSHECKIEGYELIHCNKTGSNKGAYMKLCGGELEPHFVQFNTKGHGPRALTFRQRVGLVETSAIRELTAKIQNSRDKLMDVFSKLDPNGTETVTIHEWCQTMEAGTGLRLPWRMLRSKLVSELPTDTSRVRYMTTFQENVVKRQLQSSYVLNRGGWNARNVEAGRVGVIKIGQTQACERERNIVV
ncbi:hypothetical protein LSTR_LSTR011834 [Laodelphax striatellus]|uniref:Serine/threonine-protein phosphatase n=1 Tax=Laodelphax striatellus TaxID=195883 RepID=A0A482X5R8_LAOST|nr:hypothetical protein LSTR_LSTR011834 [Laodelphax striatellus]